MLTYMLTQFTNHMIAITERISSNRKKELANKVNKLRVDSFTLFKVEAMTSFLNLY